MKILFVAYHDPTVMTWQVERIILSSSHVRACFEVKIIKDMIFPSTCLSAWWQVYIKGPESGT